MCGRSVNHDAANVKAVAMARSYLASKSNPRSLRSRTRPLSHCSPKQQRIQPSSPKLLRGSSALSQGNESVRSGQRRIVGREVSREGAAFAEFGLQVDNAFALFDEAADDGQSASGAFVCV